MVETVADLEDAHSLIDRSRISPMQMAVFGICFLMNAIDGMDVLVISYAAPVLAEQWSIAPGAIAGPLIGGMLVGYGLSIGANFRWFAMTLILAGIFTLLIKSTRVS